MLGCQSRMLSRSSESEVKPNKPKKILISHFPRPHVSTRRQYGEGQARNIPYPIAEQVTTSWPETNPGVPVLKVESIRRANCHT